MVSGSCSAVTKCPGGTQGLGSALTVPGPCPASLGGLFGTLGSVSVGLVEDTLQSGASGLGGCPPLPSLSPLFPQLRRSWGPLWDVGYPRVCRAHSTEPHSGCPQLTVAMPEQANPLEGIN